jgi:NAD+ synthetase
MPSRYSSAGTQSDARDLAEALGVNLLELPIEGPFGAFEELLSGPFDGRDPDLTEENLQARIRGTLLMALSNKFGWLVLTTGNKSELSVGYSTLYGDTAGGFAVIKDVFKLLVYRWSTCARARDAQEAARCSRSIAERPPSAELRPDQTDQDSLPPYEVLDRILEGYVELDLGRDQLIEHGLPADDVARSCASSTSPSTSAARTRPGSASPPRRSAATAGCRSPSATAADSADGDRHAGQGAAATGVVGDLHVPDPGRAPAVQPAGGRVHRALGDRAQERGGVGEAHRLLAVGRDGHRGGHGGQRLGDRRVEAAVHEPHGLLDGVAHGDGGRHELLADLMDLQAVQAVEGLFVRDDRLHLHGRGA